VFPSSPQQNQQTASLQDWGLDSNTRSHLKTECFEWGRNFDAKCVTCLSSRKAPIVDASMVSQGDWPELDRLRGLAFELDDDASDEILDEE